MVDFGAFVEILPGTDGLLHVSEMAHHRVNDVHDEVKEGDQVLVKVVSIDPSGKIRLSRKALLEEAEGGTPTEGPRVGSLGGARAAPGPTARATAPPAAGAIAIATGDPGGREAAVVTGAAGDHGRGPRR